MPDALLVVAVDFGTTYSGYAFSFKHDFERDPLKIMTSSWLSGSSMNMSLKTSSTILFNPKGQFDSFGFEAEDKYTDLTLDGAHVKWFYFRRFKMSLYNTTNIHRTTMLQDETGKMMPAIDVFAAAIRCLKEHALGVCTQRAYEIDANDILWVLTVPAIWDDQAKQFMREAAENVGIKHSGLILALEPEAASMFCKYLPVERMGLSAGKTISCFQPNSKYLVLDAGGGTVDITVHEVQKNGTLKELYKANGGPWGGTTIDQAFLNFLENIAGPEVMKRLQSEHKDDFIELMRDFEVRKRNIRPDMDSKVTIKMPIALYELYRDLKGNEMREAVLAMPSLSGKVTFAGDKMRVDASLMKSLFEKTTTNIVDHVKNLLKDPVASGVTSILMVGGFSESAMLRDAVQRGFPNIRLIVPNEADLAVLKGAVIFGHNSKAIVSRIAKYTYGLKMYKYYDPAIHSVERRIIKDDKEQVRGCFEKLVEIGQSVSVGEPSMKIALNPQTGHTGFAVKLFASSQKNPLYVDEPDCSPLGELIVDCRDRRGRVGSCTVWLIFGGTELEVRAEHTTTHEQTRASFDFIE